MVLAYNWNRPSLSPLTLSNSCSRSEAYFGALRWQGRCHYPRCQHSRKLYAFNDRRNRCPACGFRFREFTSTYLEGVRIRLHELSYVLCLCLRCSLVPWEEVFFRYLAAGWIRAWKPTLRVVPSKSWEHGCCGNGNNHREELAGGTVGRLSAPHSL